MRQTTPSAKLRPVASDDPLTLGRYRLEQKLASGGMGEVFLARMQGSAGFEKKVVIKRILPHLAQAPEFVERFLDEGRLVVQLSHGNIVQVLDMGNVDDHYYLAMEYVDGLDLRALLQSLRQADAAMPVPVAVHVAAEVAKGLGYAHSRTGDDGRNLGIIHRDVSPSNVMVSREGEVKLLDFGIAKAAGRMTHSVSGSLHGKFLYMSPEQASGRSLDQRSDLFSLGTVFYEMLTGRRPFEGESELRTLDLIRSGAHEPPRARRPEIPPEIEAIVERCLAVDVSRRYTTADELHRDLLGWLVEARAVVSHATVAELVATHLRPRSVTPPPMDLDAAINQLFAGLDGAGQKSPALGTIVAAAKVDTPLAHGETAPRATPVSHLSGRVDTSTTGRARLADMPETDVPRASRNRILIASVLLLVGVLVTLNLVTLDELRKRPGSAETEGTAPPAVAVLSEQADAAAHVPGPSTPKPGVAAPDAGPPAEIAAIAAMPDVDATPVATADAGPEVTVAAAPEAGPPDTAAVVAVSDAGLPPSEDAVHVEPQKRVVQVDVDPDTAELMVGGRVVGMGTARVPVSPDAPVRVTAHADGFVKDSVLLKFSGPRVVTMKLVQKELGSYQVRVFPASARVEVDGAAVPHSGNLIQKDIGIGDHTLVLTFGDKKKSVSFTVRAGEVSRVGTYDLEKEH